MYFPIITGFAVYLKGAGFIDKKMKISVHPPQGASLSDNKNWVIENIYNPAVKLYGTNEVMLLDIAIGAEAKELAV